MSFCEHTAYYRPTVYKRPLTGINNASQHGESHYKSDSLLIIFTTTWDVKRERHK